MKTKCYDFFYIFLKLKEAFVVEEKNACFKVLLSWQKKFVCQFTGDKV